MWVKRLRYKGREEGGAVSFIYCASDMGHTYSDMGKLHFTAEISATHMKHISQVLYHSACTNSKRLSGLRDLLGEIYGVLSV